MDIFEAIQNNNLNMVKELLDSGISVNSREEYTGLTLLMKAKSNLNIIKLLLEYPNIDVNAKDRSGWTLLHHVCYNNNNILLDLLLLRPELDVNYYNNKYNTALHIACDNNNFEIIDKLLKDSRMDINISSTILCKAIENRNFEMVKFLLEQPKIDINKKDKIYNNRSPIELAFVTYQFDIIDLLLENKNIDITRDLLFRINAVTGRHSKSSYTTSTMRKVNNILNLIET